MWFLTPSNMHSFRQNFHTCIDIYKLDIFIFICIYSVEELEDTKVVIRIRNSKKDRQDNDQNKKDKSTNNNLQLA